jgi:hypothetical protein
VHPEGFPEAVDKVQASSNRIALAMIASALALSATLVAVFAGSADIAGLSLIAIPLGLVAAALIAWLCVGIFRSGRW